jgi:hypothetical protein
VPHRLKTFTEGGLAFVAFYDSLAEQRKKQKKSSRRGKKKSKGNEMLRNEPNQAGVE